MTVYLVLRDTSGAEVAARLIAYAEVVTWLEENASPASATCNLYDRQPSQGGVFLKTLHCSRGTWS